MDIPTKNVGFHRGKPRLYFQSSSLGEFGFAPGAAYDVWVEEFGITLQAHAEGHRKVCKKVVNGKLYSIIDLNAGLDLFKGVEKVEVLYQPQRIVMRKKEQA